MSCLYFLVLKISDSVLSYKAFSKLAHFLTTGEELKQIKAFGPNFSLMNSVVAECLYGFAVLIIYVN